MKSAYKIKWNLLLVVFVLCNAIVFAQSGSVKGVVKGSDKVSPLASATITVVQLKNSVIINQALTNGNGCFILKNLPFNDSLLLKVFHLGYVTYAAGFVLNDTLLDLGDIYLTIASKQLDSVAVTGQRSPVIIRQDTIEFRASSFKTPPNAAIEDLLKKLPGMDMDAQGNLTFNGKKISKVLVDGREFFGTDPKIAIRNLPADIVDKIQVMDAKSLEQLFGSVGSSSRADNKTLNIKLKKEKKAFGSLTAGGGTDKRYEAAGMFNHFDGVKKWSLLGGANNINKIGFSLSPGADESIQSLSFIDEGNGITTSKNGGLNFSNEKDKSKYNGSYFFNDALTDRTFLKERRQYIIPDSSFLSNNSSKTKDGSANHTIDLNIERIIDSTSTLYFRPNFSYRKTNLNSVSEQQTTTPGGKLINSGENIVSTSGDDLSASGSVSWGKRFRKTGRLLFVSLNSSYANQDTEEENKVKNIFYKDSGGDSVALLNQHILSKSSTGSHSLHVSYTEPLSSRLRLNVYETLESGKSKVDRKVFTPHSAGNGGIVDSALSVNYSTTTFRSATQASLSYLSKKWDASIGASTTYTRINNEIYSQSLSLRQSQFNHAPSINFHYRIANNKDLKLNFFANTQQPTLEQLQPVVDNRNPLLIKEGNPALKPSFTPYYLLNYSVANTRSLLFFTGYLNYAPVQNAIVNSVSYDTLGRQFSRYVNVDGNYNSRATLTFKKGWRNANTQKSIGVDLQTTLTRNTIFVNAVDAAVLTKRFSPSLNLQYSYKTAFDLTASYSPSFNIVSYSTSSLTDQDFLMHIVRGALRMNIWKDFQMETNLLYNYSSQAPPGFKKDALLLNLNMTQQVFKNNRGLLKFTIYDLLKQNNNIRRTTADNYVEDVQAAILQQYFMLSFIYKLDFSK